MDCYAPTQSAAPVDGINDTSVALVDAGRSIRPLSLVGVSDPPDKEGIDSTTPPNPPSTHTLPTHSPTHSPILSHTRM